MRKRFKIRIYWKIPEKRGENPLYSLFKNIKLLQDQTFYNNAYHLKVWSSKSWTGLALVKHNFLNYFTLKIGKNTKMKQLLFCHKLLGFQSTYKTVSIIFTILWITEQQEHEKSVSFLPIKVRQQGWKTSYLFQNFSFLSYQFMLSSAICVPVTAQFFIRW